MFHFWPTKEFILLGQSPLDMMPKELDSSSSFTYLSVFSGGGIGDAGIHFGCKVPILSACELVPVRAEMLRTNFQEAEIYTGSIYDHMSSIVEDTAKKLSGKSPWLVVLSPPCQGMSTNGAGKLMKSIRQNKQFPSDERNQLIIPGVELIQDISPNWFILENVPTMENTIIKNPDGEPENIIEFIERTLDKYIIKKKRINFLDLGVPHHRTRLITIGIQKHLFDKFGFNENTDFFPAQTHFPKSSDGIGVNPSHINLEDVIKDLPFLDAISKLSDDTVKYHTIPKWNANHYKWMEPTPAGHSAFENSECLTCNINIYDLEKTEFSNLGHDDLDELVDCPVCRMPLPRPQTEFIGWECIKCKHKNRERVDVCPCGYTYRGKKMSKQRRLISGFKTSYRRLKWDRPASTITMNSGTISSDMKGHPEEHRVLSVKEILILSSMHSKIGENAFPWEKYEFKSTSKSGDSNDVSMGVIREVIGESIPPLAAHKIVSRLIELDIRTLPNSNE